MMQTGAGTATTILKINKIMNFYDICVIKQ